MPSIDNGRATLERARAERARHNQAENNPLAEIASSNLNINLAKCLDTSQYVYFKFSCLAVFETNANIRLCGLLKAQIDNFIGLGQS